MAEISFSFYLSIKALNALLQSRTYRHIFLYRDVSIYLDASIEELTAAIGDRPDETPIGSFLRRPCSGKFFLANERISQILNNPDLLSNYPYSVFVLNISRKDAKRIREEYGVLFYSDSAVPRFPQLRFKKSVFCKSEDTSKSWDSILDGVSSFPLNDIFINDRYLIPSLSNEDVSLMHKNLSEILSSLLPAKDREGTINVFIYFDAIDKTWIDDYNKNLLSAGSAQFDDKDLHESVVNEFEQKSMEIKRTVDASIQGNYNVKTICASFNRIGKNAANKTVFLKSWVEGYQYTHNRRVLTDYCHSSVDYGLLAFDKNGKSLKEQAIVTKGLYSEGLNDCSDIPEERHRTELSHLFEMKNDSILKNLLLSIDGIAIDNQRIKEELESISILCEQDDSWGTLRVK